MLNPVQFGKIFKVNLNRPANSDEELRKVYQKGLIKIAVEDLEDQGFTLGQLVVEDDIFFLTNEDRDHLGRHFGRNVQDIVPSDSPVRKQPAPVPWTFITESMKNFLGEEAFQKLLSIGSSFVAMKELEFQVEGREFQVIDINLDEEL